jgi:hypothetical protein
VAPGYEYCGDCTLDSVSPKGSKAIKNPGHFRDINDVQPWPGTYGIVSMVVQCGAPPV